jgi:hypothetical protein
MAGTRLTVVLASLAGLVLAGPAPAQTRGDQPKPTTTAAQRTAQVAPAGRPGARHCQGVGLMTLLGPAVLKHDGASHPLAGRVSFK